MSYQGDEGEDDRQYFDIDLASALNFENIVDIPLKVTWFKAIKPKSKKAIEFMLIDTPECFTEAGLKRIEEAEVILTNTDLNLEDYMTFLEK